MILVDTSVLIDYLKGTENRAVQAFEQILQQQIVYAINPYIYQEVLQGARNQKEFEKLKVYLQAIPCYSLKFKTQSFEQAAYLNVMCRQSGITIRSSIDLLIAQTAIEYDLELLHNDRDFIHMAKIIKQLKLYLL